jgi:hypothetical protein
MFSHSQRFAIHYIQYPQVQRPHSSTVVIVASTRSRNGLRSSRRMCHVRSHRYDRQTIRLTNSRIAEGLFAIHQTHESGRELHKFQHVPVTHGIDKRREGIEFANMGAGLSIEAPIVLHSELLAKPGDLDLVKVGSTLGKYIELFYDSMFIERCSRHPTWHGNPFHSSLQARRL